MIRASPLQVALLCIVCAGLRQSVLAQECQNGGLSRQTAGGSVFVELWSPDEDPFSATCCGDLFQCDELRSTCLQCDEARCDPAKICPNTDCRPFGFVCDKRRDCPDGADETHCGDIVRSYRARTEMDITATELVIYGVSLETCAAYCFFHQEKCQVFSYSNSSDGDKFAGVSQRQQIALGRPLYDSECHIGCQACGLATVQRSGYTVYHSTPSTVQLLPEVQLTRSKDDPARKLLPRHPACGRRETEQIDVATVDRVAGGTSALRGEYPWQVQIRSFNETVGAYVHTCGGVIISDRFVLTAAHCMTKALNSYEVVIGQYDWRVLDEKERPFRIREKQDVPEYLTNGTKVGDLTVLSLDLSNKPAISFSKEVRPACLIRDEDVPPTTDTPCVVSGWGSTLPGFKSFPFRLRGAKLPIVTDHYCSAKEVYGSLFVPEKMVCAGLVEGGLDTCQGDSGGGLVCQAPDGSWQVVGVVATGDVNCGAVGKPGIYTELQPYYRKILEILTALS